MCALVLTEQGAHRIPSSALRMYPAYAMLVVHDGKLATPAIYTTSPSLSRVSTCSCTRWISCKQCFASSLNKTHQIWKQVPKEKLYIVCTVHLSTTQAQHYVSFLYIQVVSAVGSSLVVLGSCCDRRIPRFDTEIVLFCAHSRSKAPAAYTSLASVSTGYY